MFRSSRKKQKEELTVGHDPGVFDAELEEHQRKEANLLLRLAIENKNLVACVRDPKTGNRGRRHLQDGRRRQGNRTLGHLADRWRSEKLGTNDRAARQRERDVLSERICH
jgi:hypothetical protein